MIRKRFVFVTLFLAATALAHDEGHGPRLTDTAKQGGVVSPVIEVKDASKGQKAPLVYKSELVRSEDGTIRFYLYDIDMNPLSLAQFGSNAGGVVEFKKNRKWSKKTFSLKPEEGAFVGKAPSVSTKPFNIDIHIKKGGKELLAAFDNLD